jgi:hypothetical protein
VAIGPFAGRPSSFSSFASLRLCVSSSAFDIQSPCLAALPEVNRPAIPDIGLSLARFVVDLDHPVSGWVIPPILGLPVVEVRQCEQPRVREVLLTISETYSVTAKARRPRRGGDCRVKLVTSGVFLRALGAFGALGKSR